MVFKPSVKDITGETVTFEGRQLDCVNYDGESALVIKGIAGSGKTLLIVQKAKEYVPKTKDITNLNAQRQTKVCIMIYNKALVAAIKYILRVNGLENQVDVYTVGSYFLTNYKHHKPYGVGKFVSDCKDTIEELVNSNKAVYGRFGTNFLQNEIEFMFSNGIADALDRTNYINMDRSGRCKEYKKRISDKDKGIIFDFFTKYLDAIHSKHLFNNEEFYSILCKRYLDEIRINSQYDSILIDEAQDFNLVNMKLTLALGSKKKVIAMDRNQSIYDNRSWAFKDLGIQYHVKKLPITYRTSKEIDELAHDLKIIDDASLDEEDRCENELSDVSTGDLPNIISCRDRNEEFELIVETIKMILPKKKTIAILLTTNNKNDKRETLGIDDFADKIRRRIGESVVKIDKNVDDNVILTPGVKISTIHSAKGLGFDTVIIPYFERDIYPSSLFAKYMKFVDSDCYQKDGNESKDDLCKKAIREDISNDRKTAYVAITRAKRHLVITYAKYPSPFISEFNKNHYLFSNATGDESYTDSRIVYDENNPDHLMEKLIDEAVRYGNSKTK